MTAGGAESRTTPEGKRLWPEEADRQSAARAAVEAIPLSVQEAAELKKRRKQENWIPNEKGRTRGLLRAMTPEQRAEFFADLDDTYCLDCGVMTIAPGVCPSCDDEGGTP